METQVSPANGSRPAGGPDPAIGDPVAPPSGEAKVLLLVEDNPGDVQLVQEFLLEQGRSGYRLVHVGRLQHALELVRTQEIDVVVLDLQLPDCHGVQAVSALREVAQQIPIVVLSGNESESVADACISAGAQDFIPKSEAKAPTLRRALGYAIMRRREAQLRASQAALANYRALSSDAQATTVTAAMAGSGAIAVRSPQFFDGLVERYCSFFDQYLGGPVDQPNLQHEKERIITAVGDVNGGPRDLVDLHVKALERVVTLDNESRGVGLVFEARLLALEMMGLLVDYYRVGRRRRS